MELSPNKKVYPVGTIVFTRGRMPLLGLEGTIGKVERVQGQRMFVRFPWPDFRTIELTHDEITTCNEVKYLDSER